LRILVSGCEGQLARGLVGIAQSADLQFVAVGRPDLDVSDPASVERTIASQRPALVINTAAYTAVDKAESDSEVAFAVNAVGAENVAKACAVNSIPIIHISTDYVFDGSKGKPYVEDDPPKPATAYGRSKREGEWRVAEACERHLILRTAWLHSPWGANFVKTMLSLAQRQKLIRVVNDQRGTPTYVPHLAAVVLELAQRAASDSDKVRWGIYHAASQGGATWFELAREVFSCAAEQGLPVAEVAPITTADYPTPALRPTDSRLSCDRLRQVFGLELPSWQAGVQECVRRLSAAAPELGT
jgi:dTDP-4-dehydrorhamnose reductase